MIDNLHSIRRGMSLIESTFALLILSGLLLSALYTLNSSARAVHHTRRADLGAMLARDLMSEIIGAAYEEPVDTAVFGPEGVESPALRADWDDVDDYANWTSSPPQERTGALFPDADGWTRTAKVVYVSVDTLADMGVSAETGLKRITVTATAPTGETTTIQSLRASAGTTESPPPLDTPFLIQATVTIQLNEMEHPVSASTTLVNGVIDQ